MILILGAVSPPKSVFLGAATRVKYRSISCQRFWCATRAGAQIDERSWIGTAEVYAGGHRDYWPSVSWSASGSLVPKLLLPPGLERADGLPTKFVLSIQSPTKWLDAGLRWEVTSQDPRKQRAAPGIARVGNHPV